MGTQFEQGFKDLMGTSKEKEVKEFKGTMVTFVLDMAKSLLTAAAVALLRAGLWI